MERGNLNRNSYLFCSIMLVIVVLPLFLVVFSVNLNEQNSRPEFFVGVEYAIKGGSVEDCKALVDRVKNFTNFFVVDTFEMTRDINNLTEVCDYVYDSGLYFMVFFISQPVLTNRKSSKLPTNSVSIICLASSSDDTVYGSPLDIEQFSKYPPSAVGILRHIVHSFLIIHPRSLYERL